MRVFLLFLFLAVSGVASAVGISLEPLSKEIEAGKPFELSLRIAVPESSYVYYKEPGETGLPTKLFWTLPQGYKIVGESWDTPEENNEDGFKVFVYKNDFYIRTVILAPSSLEDGTFKASLKVTWLKCTKGMCTPGSAETSIELATRKSAADNHLWRPQSFFLILGGAFLGGMLLNLMPCVFPVIGLKLLSFTKDAAFSRPKALKNAFLYSLGIVLSFLALAFILVALKKAGNEVGWGFQLQEPLFVVFLILLFFTMGLAFMGLFELGLGLVSLGGKLGTGGTSSFLSGVIAVIAASPCTAPFMATAIGIALVANNSNISIFAVFAFLGLGMAFPYVVLCAIPSLARLLPKPGAWMETFKQFLSFPLFATVIWLLWVFTKQSDADAMAILLFALFFLSLGLWIFGKWATPARPFKTRIFAYISLAVCLCISLGLSISSSKSFPQSPAQSRADDSWSQERVESLRKEGNMVYVDFSASWCITCLANKANVLSTDAVKKLFQDNKVKLLHADWTSKDPLITRKLAEFGRLGVPLNILYPADLKKDPIVLPQILTKQAVIDAIDKARP